MHKFKLRFLVAVMVITLFLTTSLSVMADQKDFDSSPLQILFDIDSQEVVCAQLGFIHCECNMGQWELIDGDKKIFIGGDDGHFIETYDVPQNAIIISSPNSCGDQLIGFTNVLEEYIENERKLLADILKTRRLNIIITSHFFYEKQGMVILNDDITICIVTLYSSRLNYDTAVDFQDEIAGRREYFSAPLPMQLSAGDSPDFSETNQSFSERLPAINLDENDEEPPAGYEKEDDVGGLAAQQVAEAASEEEVSCPPYKGEKSLPATIDLMAQQIDEANSPEAMFLPPYRGEESFPTTGLMVQKSDEAGLEQEDVDYTRLKRYRDEASLRKNPYERPAKRPNKGDS